MHYFETATGVKFACTTDHNCSDLREVGGIVVLLFLFLFFVITTIVYSAPTPTSSLSVGFILDLQQHLGEACCNEPPVQAKLKHEGMASIHQMI